jgi:hypothetical protein
VLHVAVVLSHLQAMKYIIQNPSRIVLKSTSIYQFVRCHKLYSCHNTGFLRICHCLRNFFFDIIRLFTAKHISGKDIKMDTEENGVWPLGAGDPLENSYQKVGNAETVTIMGNSLNILEY